MASFLVNANWSVSLETRILKCYLNYPIGQLSDFLLPLDPRQVPSWTCKLKALSDFLEIQYYKPGLICY